MTIAIVDDSNHDIQLLYDHICRYCNEHKVHVQIERYTNEVLFLRSLQNIRYNLVFLDIFMPRANGLQITKKLSEVNPACQVILTTTSKEHAIKAFRLHVLDYLLKPISYTHFEDAMNRYEEVSSRFAHYIELKEGRYYTRILVNDILYVDYYNHYVQVHTSSNVVRSYMPFNDFAPMLKPYPQFLWCYRNCMVNMDYIESLDDRDFILKNHEHLPISRTYKKDITQAYANYIFDFVNGGTAI